MKIPERVIHRLKKIIRRGHTALSRRSLKTRPFADEDSKRGETPLRMIYRACAADVPDLRRENQSLQIIAMRPPTIPELSNIFARGFL